MFWLLDWLRFPIVFSLRLFSCMALLAVPGCLFLSEKLADIAAVILVVTSFVCSFLAKKYDQMLDRHDPR